MKAVRILRPGGPEVLELSEVEDPVPGPGEILVRVRAAGVNRADLLQCRGLYPAPPGVPADIPGLEFAGEVEAVGSGVRSPAIGDPVMGILGGGGYAEKIVTRAGLAVPVPSGLTAEEAAAIPEAFFTAFDALVLQGGLRAGERVLIHAAGSGVGTAALQIAAEFGASQVFGTASAGKLAGASALGLPLDVPIDREAASFRDVIRERTDGAGVELILDLVGASIWEDNLESLAVRGRQLLVGLLGGARATTDLGTLLRRRARITGTVLRARSLEEKLSLTREFRLQVLPRFEAGRLRPVLDREFPLAAAAEAHRYVQANRNLGKVVLTLA